jgi:hypothetical protein
MAAPTYRDVEHAYDFLPTRPVRTPEEFQRFVRHAALVAVPGHGPCAPCAAPGEERVRQTQGTERAEGPEERGKNPHTQPPASDRRESPQEQNPNIYHIGNTNNKHQDMNENERKRIGIAASRLWGTKGGKGSGTQYRRSPNSSNPRTPEEGKASQAFPSRLLQGKATRLPAAEKKAMIV